MCIENGCYDYALNALKLGPNYLKLFTAVIVAAFLAVPYLKGQAKSSFHRLKKGGK